MISALNTAKWQSVLLFANIVQQYCVLNKYVFHPMKQRSPSSRMGKRKAGNLKIIRADPLIRCMRTNQRAHTVLYVLYSNRQSGLYETQQLVFMKQMWADACTSPFNDLLCIRYKY